MQTILAIFLGKTISYLTRLFKIGGGSAAPGLYALKLDPNLVENLVKKIPKNIIITGTNGKTTTSRMVAHFAKAEGLKVIRNHTGSNLERGIASTLISNYGLGTRNYELGIWELDEAAFNSVAPKINPDIVVFLNIFRDQLDRYGEIDTIVKKWEETLKKLSPKTIIIVNGDDANILKLAKNFTGRVQKFGVKGYKIIGESVEQKQEKENLDFEAREIKLHGLNGSSFKLFINRKSLIINLPLPGIYHIYDTLAAFASAHFLGLPINRLSNHLINFSPAFGRVEELDFGYIFLIKNPAGATQVFETIAPQLKPQDRLLLALNDNLADGTDVSWIWDGDFEKLNSPSGTRSEKLKVICSGTRAYDLALRLKYAGFDPKNITVVPEIERALKEAKTGLKGLPAGRQGRLFVLPTYTAMLELQSILAKSGIKKHYWKESD